MLLKKKKKFLSRKRCISLFQVYDTALLNLFRGTDASATSATAYYH